MTVPDVARLTEIMDRFKHGAATEWSDVETAFDLVRKVLDTLSAVTADRDATQAKFSGTVQALASVIRERDEAIKERDEAKRTASHWGEAELRDEVERLRAAVAASQGAGGDLIAALCGAVGIMVRDEERDATGSHLERRNAERVAAARAALEARISDGDRAREALAAIRRDLVPIARDVDFLSADLGTRLLSLATREVQS